MPAFLPMTTLVKTEMKHEAMKSNMAISFYWVFDMKLTGRIL